ncbi:MAG: response regulator [Verrucomicrobia bacterium]|nr:response regulator [Verrucomicrobiota bacterium]
MPGINGLEVLTWLRSHSECKAIPVVILTLSEREQDIMDAYRLGATAYLIKPFTIDDLEKMIKSVFRFCAGY